MPREFPKKFPLVRGLRPRKRMRVDDGFYLENIEDGRVDNTGVYPLATVSTPFTGASFTVSWPTPMFQLVGSSKHIMDDTKIYTVNEARAVTAETLYQGRDVGTEFTTLNSADVWQVCGWGGQFFFSDGTTLIWRTSGNSGDKYLALTDIGPKAITMTHNHRLVLGGCRGTYFNSGSFSWQTIVDIWREVPGAEMVIHEDQDIKFDDGVFVLISDPGMDVRYPYQLFMTLFATPTLAKFTSVVPFFREMILSRQFEFVRVIGRGEVLAAEALGSSLILYTHRDVVRLDPLDGGGYSQTQISQHGILGRGAVASNMSITSTANTHLWVDSRGYLHKTTNEGVQELGYNEYLSTLTATTIVTWDEEELEFRIGDNATGINGFLYTVTNELVKTSKITTGLYYGDGFEDEDRSGEYVTDGDFSADTNWTEGADWSIAGGV
ncbi:MAG: hypothetical protein ACXABY_10755, partial [Candidatus Thorarchaeota archaeon]